ncbi:non-ribosomal peptide synthetase [Amycolatopsis vastitatis]|uniref:Carrier domain-containing protein n=1 Tax=Amycolatopsis vastitatis TaxID=1905142 RepID=A0A229SKJ8_9PSEU|nr:non-ribosomal peptide synthetase [Amycolatopsis vastitatis]OXM59356.1 hypothetical protein CF165_48155 [Amycolatopsis vastitatis]
MHDSSSAADPAEVTQAHLGPDELLPLTAVQRAILGQEDSAEVGVGNIPIELELRGAMSVPRLRTALDRLVARHEALRLRLVDRGRDTFQTIKPPEPAGAGLLDVIDVSAPPAASTLEATLARESKRPLNLYAGEVLRARLFVVAPEHHILLLVGHHVSLDGWSIDLLVDELARVYAGQDPAPAPSWRDHAGNTSEKADHERAVAAVGQRLLDSHRSFNLEPDHPEAAPAEEAAVLGEVLPPDICRRLHDLERRTGSSQFVVHLAVLAELLGDGSGDGEVAIATPVVQRAHLDSQDLVGPLTETVPVFLAVPAIPDVDSRLFAARLAVADALERADLPFQAINRACTAPTGSRYPAVPISLAVVGTPEPIEGFAPARCVLREPNYRASRFEFTLLVEAADTDRIRITLQYDPNRFDRSTADSLVAGYVALVRRLVTPADRARPADRSSSAEPDLDLGGQISTLAHLVSGLASTAGDRQAAIEGERQVTYRELMDAAVSTASHLAERVGPPHHDAPATADIALVLPRSIGFLVGLLATQILGWSFVPIDPNLPTRRIQHMLADSGARGVLVRDEAERARLGLPGTVCFPVTSPGEARRTALPVTSPSALSPAYVLYTSGSTGKPKGVLVPHRALDALRQEMAALDVHADDRVLMAASPSFDAVIWEVLLAFTSGAALAIAPPSTVAQGEDLGRFIKTHGVTVATMTPTVAGAVPPSDLTRLRLLVCAGEVLPRRLVQRLTGLRVLNAYGPTEAAVCATIGDARLGGRRVPIGHPLSRTTVTIRDARGRPVPAGTAGEIVISGPKLALGYLNRPAETERAFVADPEGAPGSTMLRTGDMGRYGPSGVEYLGRGDRQVKIRGQRLELEEVDLAVAAVAGRPAVAELTEVDGQVVLAAVVLSAQEDPEGARMIDNTVTAEFHRRLVERLPEWAIPSFFVSVESMPIGSSGKIDRAGLRELLAAAARLGSQGGAAVKWTTVEAAVARSWEALLGKKVDSRERTFFELGGHSMLVAKAIREIRELTRKDLPVTEFFAHPTVAGIAAALERLT